MLKKITNNPFRVLGVYSNSRKSDIVRNVSKINAFLAVGKNIDFTEDYSSVLGDIDRTQQMVKGANQELTLAKDRFSYALFWFAKNNESDSIALSELQKGNIEKAITILSSVKEPSSFLNLAVLYLIKEDYELAASIYSEICKPEMLKSISDLICDDTFSISPEDVIVGVALTLQTVVPTNLLLDYFKDSDYFVQIRSKSIEPSLQKARPLINKAKNVESSDPVASLMAGKELMDASKEITEENKSVCGSDSSEFQSVSDNFAKQILQCGINCFNNSDDADKASMAKDLAEYALSISIGALVKDRCQENYDNLKKNECEQVKVNTSDGRYAYLDLYPLDEVFNGTLGKIEMAIVLITFIVSPLVIIVSCISDDGVVLGIIEGLFGGFFVGPFVGFMLVYALRIFVNAYTIIINCIIWIINLFHKS